MSGSIGITQFCINSQGTSQLGQGSPKKLSWWDKGKVIGAKLRVGRAASTPTVGIGTKTLVIMINVPMVVLDNGRRVLER